MTGIPVRKVFLYTTTIIKWTLALIVAFILGCNFYNVLQRSVFQNPYPKVFGLGWAEIVSDSMAPTIHRGDVVVTVEKQSYAVGEVILYREDNVYVTHRIVDIDENGNYVTKGDSLQSDGVSVIAHDQVEGGVFLMIAQLGKATSFCSEPVGMLCLLAVGAAIIFFPEEALRNSGNDNENENDEK